jgi:predicted transcriptional regulator of viral defense system
MMISTSRPTLSTYVSQLLSEGRTVFSREEAQRALGIGSGAWLDAAERQQRRKALISPRRGFYVIVPPQYLGWGAPPPSWYIDSLMRYEGHSYYVGLLKAAELHGASHQAVMEFQVVTDKRLPRIIAGRSAIGYYYRKDMAAISTAIEPRKTDTGQMMISSIELTVLDLLRYPHASGGLSHVATVLTELAARIESARLGALAPAFERAVVQRLGHLLDWLGHTAATDALRSSLGTRALTWVELEPSQTRIADLTPEPVARDARWHVIVRERPEPDA